MGNGFDLEKQAEQAKLEDKGIDVHIHGVDEKPLFYEKDGQQFPVIINVSGAHSSQYRRVEQALRRRKLKPKNFTGELIYEDTIEKAAACTNGWEGFFINGKPIDPTPHNIKEVYKRAPWVLDQVTEAMHDHQSFFSNSSPTQSNT